jgi:hypothetical protein
MEPPIVLGARRQSEARICFAGRLNFENDGEFEYDGILKTSTPLKNQAWNVGLLQGE